MAIGGLLWHPMGTLKLWKDARMCSKAVLSAIGVRWDTFGIMLLLHLSYLNNSELDLHVQICEDFTQQVKMNHQLWLTVDKLSCTLSLLPLEAHCMDYYIKPSKIVRYIGN